MKENVTIVVKYSAPRLRSSRRQKQRRIEKGAHAQLSQRLFTKHGEPYQQATNVAIVRVHPKAIGPTIHLDGSTSAEHSQRTHSDGEKQQTFEKLECGDQAVPGNWN